MFGNYKSKKTRNKLIVMASGIAILLLGMGLAVNDINKDNDSEKTINQVKTIDEEHETRNNDVEDVTETIPRTYLIKEVEGVVKVFIHDEEGNEVLYLITSIPFDVLSDEDQKLLRNGVELETEEDLGRFLENFDS